MSRIKKKTWPELFQKVLDGDKTFDLRLNDFEIAEGDTLVMREWNPQTREYTGREVEKRVGFVGKWKLGDLEQFWPRQNIEDKGIQVISLKDN